MKYAPFFVIVLGSCTFAHDPPCENPAHEWLRGECQMPQDDNDSRDDAPVSAARAAPSSNTQNRDSNEEGVGSGGHVREERSDPDPEDDRNEDNGSDEENRDDDDRNDDTRDDEERGGGRCDGNCGIGLGNGGGNGTGNEGNGVGPQR